MANAVYYELIRYLTTCQELREQLEFNHYIPHCPLAPLGRVNPLARRVPVTKSIKINTAFILLQPFFTSERVYLYSNIDILYVLSLK